MKRIFLLALIQGISITCQANESIQIRDSEDSRLYLAPKHARRSGLSSYILRAPSTSRPASKYFTGSPKPIWDDDSVDKPRKIITLECLGGSACSQSIPLWSDSDEENSVYDNYEEAPKVTFRPILKKQTTSSTTETPLKSLGLSVASIYNPPRGSQWPKITRKPTITRRPTLVHHNRRSQQPPIFQNAETLWPSQPLYHNYERYDPFAFQREKLVQPKRRSTQLTRRRTPEQQFEVPAKVSHYMDSRFDVALQSDGPYRSSLTWKNGKPKSNFQNSRPSCKLQRYFELVPFFRPFMFTLQIQTTGGNITLRLEFLTATKAKDTFQAGLKSNEMKLKLTNRDEITFLLAMMMMMVIKKMNL